MGGCGYNNYQARKRHGGLHLKTARRGVMKRMSLCGCALFQSLCQFFFNRRKWIQDKKRLQVLKRLEQLSATVK
jgi:hypothetical protein